MEIPMAGSVGNHSGSLRLLHDVHATVRSRPNTQKAMEEMEVQMSVLRGHYLNMIEVGFSFGPDDNLHLASEANKAFHKFGFADAAKLAAQYL